MMDGNFVGKTVDITDNLRKTGLLNAETSYTDLVGVGRQQFVAMCLSKPCVGTDNGYVTKTVKGRPTFCPDCDHALVWSQKKDALKKEHNAYR